MRKKNIFIIVNIFKFLFIDEFYIDIFIQVEFMSIFKRYIEEFNGVFK